MSTLIQLCDFFCSNYFLFLGFLILFSFLIYLILCYGYFKLIIKSNWNIILFWCNIQWLIKGFGKFIWQRKNQCIIETSIIRTTLFNILIDVNYHHVKVFDVEVALQASNVKLGKIIQKFDVFSFQEARKMFHQVNTPFHQVNTPFHLDWIWGLIKIFV